VKTRDVFGEEGFFLVRIEKINNCTALKAIVQGGVYA
jgi:hypothetical protein